MAVLPLTGIDAEKAAKIAYMDECELMDQHEALENLCCSSDAGMKLFNGKRRTAGRQLLKRASR
eukprot:7502842-Lingulodinium_polyedra.AAC.1